MKKKILLNPEYGLYATDIMAKHLATEQILVSVGEISQDDELPTPIEKFTEVLMFLEESEHKLKSASMKMFVDALKDSMQPKEALAIKSVKDVNIEVTKEGMEVECDIEFFTEEEVLEREMQLQEEAKILDEEAEFLEKSYSEKKIIHEKKDDDELDF